MKNIRMTQTLGWNARRWSLVVCLLTSLIFSCKRGMHEVIDDTDEQNGSVVGDVVGKLTVGYQGWFGAAGDQSPFNSWRHWTVSGAPAPNNQSFELWPDVREYTNSYSTAYAHLGNGQQAQLFSSWDAQTVDLHFQWMKEYGIDCAALQRFGNHMTADPRDRNFKNGLLEKERAAAEHHAVKFYVMYDISGWTNFQTEIKADWTNLVRSYTASPMYAKQNNKPVVCIWGIGVSGRPGDVTTYTDVINWFQNEGCYVIVGTARPWRSDTNNLPAFNQADMISPWSVGTFSNLTGVDSYADIMEADYSHCVAQGQDYQPVVFPGFAWSNWKPGNLPNQIPRLHGDFMWRQLAHIRNLDIPSGYIAMFDEYDEATAIAKAAENVSMIPTDQYFLTLDADGVACSADFYLRLANDGGKMIRKETALVWEHPTAHQ